MTKYTLVILVFISFIFTSCKPTKNTDSEKENEVSIKIKENKIDEVSVIPEKNNTDIDFKSLDFDGFFKEFKKSVSSKDKVLFEKLSELSDRSLYDIDQLKNQFDEIFNTSVTKQISEVNSSKMMDELIGNDTVKVLRAKSQLKIKDQMIESTTILHFKKTDNGWKLFKTIVIE